MSFASPLERIRVFVTEVFQRIDSSVSPPLRETVVIRDGCYCGHRFTSSELCPVWFLEEDQVKFYGAEGTLVQVASPSEVSNRAA